MKILIEDTINSIETVEKNLNKNVLGQWFDSLSDHHDSEIRFFEDEKENYVASFTWQGMNKWKIDCPIELQKIHRQRYATTKECRYLLGAIYNTKDSQRFEDFLDVPIRHFNLDDMLAFQEEDEMMLNGQDPYEEEEVAVAPPPKKVSQPKKKPTTSHTMGEELPASKTNKVAKEDSLFQL